MMKYKYGLLYAALTVVAIISGCSLLDAANGISPAPGGGVQVDPNGGVIGAALRAVSAVPGWIGLIGSLLGLAGTAYQQLRVRNYRDAAGAVIRGVDRALDSGKLESVTKDQLYDALRKEAALIKDPDFLAGLVAIVKAASRQA